jgi:hypothetical protein
MIIADSSFVFLRSMKRTIIFLLSSLQYYTLMVILERNNEPHPFHFEGSKDALQKLDYDRHEVHYIRLTPGGGIFTSGGEGHYNKGHYLGICRLTMVI